MDKKTRYAPRAVLRDMLRLFRIDARHAWLATLGAVLTAAARYGNHLLNGLLMRTATDGAMQGSPVWGVVALMALGLCVAEALRIPGYRLNSWGAQKVGGLVQKAMCMRWLRQDERSAKNRHSAEVMSRILRDGGEVGEFFFQGAGMAVIDPLVMGAAALVTVWLVDFRFVLLLLLVGLVSAVVSTLFSRAIHRLGDVRAQTDEGAVTAFSNLVSGALSVKTLGIEQRMVAACGSAAERAGDAAARQERWSKTAVLVQRLFEGGGMVGCLLLAATLAQQGAMDFADVMLVLPMQALVSNMLAGLGTAWNTFTTMDVSARRVYEILDMPVEDARDGLPPFSPVAGAPALDCRAVSFGYMAGSPVLNGLTLQVPQNTRVAVAGASGGGKSTLFGLVLGNYLPDAGSIRLYGVLPQQCSLAGWRAQMALVQQESPMLDMSIADNIALGRLGDGETPGQAEIEKAARQAGAHDFIMALPQGYDTHAGEMGAALSGGQRQRIAIARAFLSRAPLVLLDEPTSALDNENEQLVTEALRRLGSSRTVLAVAHRLSTVRDYDEIVVLDGGAVAERGTHEALLARDGLYAKLWRIGRA